MTFILGLTGGIATGKSSVSRYFLQKGFPVVDADTGARKVVERDTEGWRRIRETFGKEVFHEDGTLDRKRLGAVVFTDSSKRQLLDSLLRDLIRNWMEQETKHYQKEHPALIVWDIPLLYEAQYEEACDAVMVVYVPEEIQRERLIKRNGFTKEEAENRINSQWPMEDKKKKADILIDNSGTLEATYQQIDKWLQENAERLERTRL